MGWGQAGGGAAGQRSGPAVVRGGERPGEAGRQRSGGWEKGGEGSGGGEQRGAGEGRGKRGRRGKGRRGREGRSDGTPGRKRKRTSRRTEGLERGGQAGRREWAGGGPRMETGGRTAGRGRGRGDARGRGRREKRGALAQGGRGPGTPAGVGEGHFSRAPCGKFRGCRGARAGREWAWGGRLGLPPAVPVRRILMLEPFLRVPGFDISRQRSGSRGSSAAAPRPDPARPRRRRLKVTAPGWAPGSSRDTNSAAQESGRRADARAEGSALDPAPPTLACSQPSPEPPLPPPSPPQIRTPAALAASAAVAASSQSRARLRCGAGPAPRAPGLCTSLPACARAPAEHVGVGRVARQCCPLGRAGCASCGPGSRFLPVPDDSGPPTPAVTEAGGTAQPALDRPGSSPHSRRGFIYGCGR